MSSDWYGPIGIGGGLVFYWTIGAVLSALFVTALVHDAQGRRWVWLVAELMLPPIAVVRGILMWMERL
jgi:hypothetical protein